MKMALGFFCTLLFAAPAFAQESSAEKMSMRQSTRSFSEVTPTAANPHDSNWNLNIGLSTIDSSGSYSTFQGKGITLELQRKITDLFLVGASYTNYKTTEDTNYDEYGYAPYNSYLDVFTASAEVHPIHVVLPGNTEFFVAVDAGAFYSRQTSSLNRSNYFYGAGLGLNYNDQVGIRFDMKSNPDLRASNSISAIGYF